MQNASLTEMVVIAALCLGAALLAALWVLRRQQPNAAALRGVADAVFLLDQTGLVDASASARALLDRSDVGNDWDSIQSALGKRFPDLPETQDSIESRAPLICPAESDSDPARLLVEWIDGLIRLHIVTRDSTTTKGSVLAQTSSLDDRELRHLRAAMDGAPYPTWRITAHGTLDWANAAYYALVRESGYDPDSGPLFVHALADKGAGPRVRVSLQMPQREEPQWFDVLHVQQDDGFLYYAIDVDAVVRSEAAQRNFVQTLAKTFAQLSIGLAIFDRDRQLALFNPALIDLTTLPADFLIGRPTLLSFFDRLRDNRMMPEPKNYGSWRHQMADLVAAAADGRYHDTWSLPSGSVYRVSGRPHPDGAVAFLFEDITAEVTLNRRFRTELELSQSLLDHLEDAVAVFLPNGVMTVSNAAYRTLWAVDPDLSFADVTILDATRDWQENCMATPIWGDLRDYVVDAENRTDWWAPITLKSGAEYLCSVHPVHSGATMVCFRSLQSPPAKDDTTAIATVQTA